MTGPGGQGAADFARWYRDRALEQWKALDVEAIGRLAAWIVEAQETGRQVLVMGNGGSAASCSWVRNWPWKA